MKTATKTFYALAFALASAMGLGATADAASSKDGLNRWVEVFNDAPSAIVSLEAINVDYSGDWHEYLSRVRIGDSEWVDIDDGLGYCRFDIYLTFADSSDAFVENVNVCDMSWLEAYSTRGKDRQIYVA